MKTMKIWGQAMGNLLFCNEFSSPYSEIFHVKKIFPHLEGIWSATEKKKKQTNQQNCFFFHELLLLIRFIDVCGWNNGVLPPKKRFVASTNTLGSNGALQLRKIKKKFPVLHQTIWKCLKLLVNNITKFYWKRKQQDQTAKKMGVKRQF